MLQILLPQAVLLQLAASAPSFGQVPLQIQQVVRGSIQAVLVGSMLLLLGEEGEGEADPSSAATSLLPAPLGLLIQAVQPPPPRIPGHRVHNAPHLPNLSHV